jgi:hypothetical protein
MRAAGCLLIASLSLGACSTPSPSPVAPSPTPGTQVDCLVHPSSFCDTSLASAIPLLRREHAGAADRIVVNVGRSSLLNHAEVHACYADSQYLLIDVFWGHGEQPDASVRTVPWEDPPCR